MRDRSRRTPERREPRTHLRAALAALVVSAIGACAAPAAAPPVPEAASLAFAEAWRLMRADAPPAAAILRAAERASALAPEWVAPRRFLDNRLREALLAHVALATYRDLLAVSPHDARLLYLAGRLEGEGGEARFGAALRADPALAWSHHGAAWSASTRGVWRLAIHHGASAFALARDPWERDFFAQSLARYQRAAGETEAAIGTLVARLAASEPSPEARLALAVQLAGIELRAEEEPVRLAGYRRTLALLATEGLAAGEIELLVRGVQAPSRPIPADRAARTTDLALALLAVEPGRPVRERLRALLLLREQPTPLGLELLVRGTEDEQFTPPGSELRSIRITFGRPREAVEHWLAQLPGSVLDGSGLPLDPRLARVVETARALDSAPAAGALSVTSRSRAFGAALIAAGWFEEARALAAGLPWGGGASAEDLSLATDLDARALAGRSILASIERLLYSLDDGEALVETGFDATREIPASPTAVESLDDLLSAIAPHVARAHAFLGGETDPERVRESFLGAPRVGYGWAGSLLHPGPALSAQDEALGRGAQGTPVGGLTGELLALGRFGLFGKGLGDDPDGTVLRLLYLERRAGAHMGRPWSGTMAWCEGADVPGRASRQGIAIGGAALHEGFWLDVSIVRRELEPWRAVARRFADDEEGLRLALDAPAIRVRPGEDRGPQPSGATEPERASPAIVLGEGDRVRLAVLAERAQGTELLGTMTLDELVEITAIHEEGHLCDRWELYPVGDHLMAIFVFLARAQFSARRVAEVLEYRAQLVALCEAPDPRLPLVDLLSAAENGGNGVTPHGAAYTELLGDFLRELDRALSAAPDDWPELRAERLLVQQLHRLAPAKVRLIALSLAGEHGLVR